MNNQWPTDRIEFVKKQRASGRTATEIVKDLKREFGVVKTRNSIIGILTRHNVPTPTIARTTRERANETSRVMGRMRAKKESRGVEIPAHKGPVLSPNAKAWLHRCDARDQQECAYLLDAGLACCNPVAGGGTTFQRRYCSGHLAVMVDHTKRGKLRPSRIENIVKYSTRGERVESVRAQL